MQFSVEEPVLRASSLTADCIFSPPPGELLNGRLHGRGRWRSPGGSYYCGAFLDGLLNGELHYVSPDQSSVFMGTFRGSREGGGIGDGCLYTVGELQAASATAVSTRYLDHHVAVVKYGFLINHVAVVKYGGGTVS